MGRPIVELVETYLEQKKKCLGNQLEQNICETVHISLFSGLSLSEYLEARSLHCQNSHTYQCFKCERFIKVAEKILEDGYCSLSDAFRMVAPDVTYTAEHARRLLLQMPLVAIRIGDPKKGCSFIILMEKFPGTDYSKMANILAGLANSSMPHTFSLEKPVVKMLLSIAESDRERECLRYAIYKASGMTATMARRTYGFEDMSAHAVCVESVLSEVKQIREAIDELANTQESLLLSQLGFNVQPDSSTDLSTDDSSENDAFAVQCVEQCDKINSYTRYCHGMDEDDGNMHSLLMKCKYNWFEFLEQYQSNSLSDAAIDVSSLFNEVSKLKIDTAAFQLLEQSYQAFHAVDTDMYEQDQIARIVNGEIVSESESDDPEKYVGLLNPFSESAKSLVVKRRQQIRRRARRQKAKAVAERRFLSRKISKKGSRILKECPDVGKTIEAYVQDRNVGADAWRRTGVLTFDGNVKLKQKATYEGIRLHLQEVYNRNFSYGTVVQLCVARNKRRKSAKRYQGVAKVTSRRCRKGFTLKFNPDAHWSAAFYRGLNTIQY